MPRAPSFEALYREYADRIYRYCLRLTGSPADAEDLTQEVFLLAYQNLSGFEGRASAATWLYRIALRRWYRLLSTNRLSTVPLDDEHLSFADSSLPGASAEDPAPQVFRKLALDEALAALPESLRAAFLLVKAEGLTYREAAEVLESPIGTIQSRVHDASLRLRALLRDDGSAPETRQNRGTALKPVLCAKGGSQHEV